MVAIRKLKIFKKIKYPESTDILRISSADVLPNVTPADYLNL